VEQGAGGGEERRGGRRGRGERGRRRGAVEKERRGGVEGAGFTISFSMQIPVFSGNEIFR